jgi:hypothetical protein
MDKISQLKKQVFSTDSPPRSLIVPYLKALAAQARQVSVSARDDLAYEMLRPFVELDDPPDGDSDLEYIVFQLVGGSLDVLREDGIATLPATEQIRDRKLKEAAWQELLSCIEQLSAK